MEGLCNGDPYVTDITAKSFPWIGVSHHMFRTTQLRDIQISGEPVIPREVNLIDPTMRGWGVLVLGQGLPDPLLPIGPKQDAEMIVRQREQSAQVREARWRVEAGELRYTTATSSSVSDSRGQIQYLRPLLEGETVEMSFWWDWETAEMHPSVGRVVLELSPEGVTPTWLRMTRDAGIAGYVWAEKVDPPLLKSAADNVPVNESWNTLMMTRRGDSVAVALNDKPLIDVPITEPPRIGILRRTNRDVRVRSMKLVGDWPDTLPADLMQQAD